MRRLRGSCRYDFGTTQEDGRTFLRVDLTRNDLDSELGSVGCSMHVYLLRGDLRCMDRLDVLYGLRLIRKLLDVLGDWKRRKNRDLTFPQTVLLQDHGASHLRLIGLLW